MKKNKFLWGFIAKSDTTVNPNTLWCQFQANISKMVGRINTGTSVLSL